MKFRNFDKIGLENEEQIKEFLGSDRVKGLQANEESLRTVLIDDWKMLTINNKFSLETTVCLLSNNTEDKQPLLCVIEPSLKRVDMHTPTERLEPCYRLETRDGSCISTSYSKSFNSLTDAFIYVDECYGINSKDGFERKIMRSDEAE